MMSSDQDSCAAEHRAGFLLAQVQQQLCAPIVSRRALRGRLMIDIVEEIRRGRHGCQLQHILADISSRLCQSDMSCDDWWIGRADNRLPSGVRELADPPFGLHTRGDIACLTQTPRVAIVGSRRPHPSSLAIAGNIANAVVRGGGVVISGLAIGVDAAAHRGALAAHGRTIAVIGSGIERPYPASHRDLAATITGSDGLLISEWGGAVSARRWMFPMRNRLIASMADLVVVVQAAERSGSLQTARTALDLGIAVAVVPGGIMDPAWAGSTALLRDGAPAVVDPISLGRCLGTDIPAARSSHEFEEILALPRSVDDVAAFSQ